MTSHLKINLWCHHQPHAPSWNVGNLELMGWTDLNMNKSLGSLQRLLSFPPGPHHFPAKLKSGPYFFSAVQAAAWPGGQTNMPAKLTNCNKTTWNFGPLFFLLSSKLHHPTKQQQLQNTPRPRTSQYRSIQSQQVLNLLPSCHHVK